jgi:DNA-binding transcriptional ArsR family regulator
MARSATTLDAFSAIAEPKRRELLNCLASGERDVSQLIAQLGWPQSAVSKHLSVLRAVNLVSVRAEGRKRSYRINGDELRTIHEWAALFEKHWSNQLIRIKRRAEQASSSRQAPLDPPRT